MPKKPVPHEKSKDDDIDLDVDGFEDDEPIPARRDIRIFHRDKEEKKDDKTKKDDDFEEDVFV